MLKQSKLPPDGALAATALSSEALAANADRQRRVQRATRARLYLLHQVGPSAFQVCGDGGEQAAKVILGPQTCTCKQPRPCVHILFVMLRVLKVEENDPKLFAPTLLNYECEALVKNFQTSRLSKGLRAPTRSKQQQQHYDDCPICLLEMIEGEATLACQRCKNCMHRNCLNVWASVSKKKVECPLCRAVWVSSSVKEKDMMLPDASPWAADASLPAANSIPADQHLNARPLILCFGEALVRCHFSPNWTAREAALRRVGLDLATRGREANLRAATAKMLESAFRDRVLRVYLAALEVLAKLFDECSLSDPQSKELLNPLINITILYCGDANKRKKDASAQALVGFIRNKGHAGFELVMTRVFENEGSRVEDLRAMAWNWWHGRFSLLLVLFETSTAEFADNKGKLLRRLRQWLRPARKHPHQRARLSAFLVQEQAGVMLGVLRSLKRNTLDPAALTPEQKHVLTLLKLAAAGRPPTEEGATAPSSAMENLCRLMQTCTVTAGDGAEYDYALDDQCPPRKPLDGDGEEEGREFNFLEHFMAVEPVRAPAAANGAGAAVGAAPSAAAVAATAAASSASSSSTTTAAAVVAVSGGLSSVFLPRSRSSFGASNLASEDEEADVAEEPEPETAADIALISAPQPLRPASPAAAAAAAAAAAGALDATYDGRRLRRSRSRSSSSSSSSHTDMPSWVQQAASLEALADLSAFVAPSALDAHEDVAAAADALDALPASSSEPMASSNRSRSSSSHRSGGSFSSVSSSGLGSSNRSSRSGRTNSRHSADGMREQKQSSGHRSSRSSHSSLRKSAGSTVAAPATEDDQFPLLEQEASLTAAAAIAAAVPAAATTAATATATTTTAAAAATTAASRLLERDDSEEAEEADDYNDDNNEEEDFENDMNDDDGMGASMASGASMVSGSSGVVSPAFVQRSSSFAAASASPPQPASACAKRATSASALGDRHEHCARGCDHRHHHHHQQPHQPHHQNHSTSNGKRGMAMSLQLHMAGLPSQLDPLGMETVALNPVPVTVRQPYVEGSQWRKEALVGKGASSSAFVAVDEASGQQMVVKQVPYAFCSRAMEQNQLRNIALEIEIMRRLPLHPNIVTYYGAVPDSSHFNIFMEYVEGGSLSHFIRDHGLPTREQAVHITRQLVTSVAFLHEHGILHRDIKCANVLVCGTDSCSAPLDTTLLAASADGDEGTAKSDMKESSAAAAITAAAAAAAAAAATPRLSGSFAFPCDVKLCDFGTASVLSAECTLSGEFHTTMGTAAFMAPEVIRGESYGRKADVWSLGCLVIEMLTGRPPWTSSAASAGAGNQFALMFRIASTQEMPDIPTERLGPLGEDFVRQCLNRDPSKRPTAAELAAHPFLHQYSDVSQSLAAITASATPSATSVASASASASASVSSPVTATASATASSASVVLEQA